MAKLERQAHEYFSTLSSISKKIMDEQDIIERMYGDDWKQMSATERDDMIDSYLIDAAVIELYKDIPEPESCNPFPVLNLGSGEKIIVDFENEGGWTWTDEHSAPFSWETKSQLNMPLFETEEEASKRLHTIERPKKPKRHSECSNDGNKSVEFPWKPEKSIWDSPFLALDRGDDYDFSLRLDDDCFEDETDKANNSGSSALKSRKIKAASRAKSITEEAEQLFANFKLSIALEETNTDNIELPSIEDPNAEHMYAKIPPPSLLEPKYEDEPQYLQESNFPVDDTEEELHQPPADEPVYKTEGNPRYSEVDENAVESPYILHVEPAYNELDEGKMDPPYNELLEETRTPPVAAPRRINVSKHEPAYNELELTPELPPCRRSTVEPPYNVLEEESSTTKKFQSLQRSRPEPPYNILDDSKAMSLHHKKKEAPYNVLDGSSGDMMEPPYNVLDDKILAHRPIGNEENSYYEIDKKIDKLATKPPAPGNKKDPPYSILDDKMGSRPTAAMRRSKTEPKYNELVGELAKSSRLKNTSSVVEPPYNILEKEPSYVNSSDEPAYALHEQDYSAEPAYALYDRNEAGAEPTYMLYERPPEPKDAGADGPYMLYDSSNPYMSAENEYMNEDGPYMNAPDPTSRRNTVHESEPLYDVLEVSSDGTCIYEDYGDRDDIYCPVPIRNERRSSNASNSSTVALLQKSPDVLPKVNPKTSGVIRRYNEQRGEESIHLTSDDSLDINEQEFLRPKNARANIKSDTIKSGFDFLDDW